MRKVTLYIACSLDGFIARKDGSIDWLFNDADYGYQEFYDSVDTLLIGRKTYEQALGFGEWPYLGKKCYVFTRKKDLHDGRVVFTQNLVAVTKELLAQPGKDIWLVGGAEIITALLNTRLVNELRIFVHPIILGDGIPLFKDIDKEIKLELVKTVSFDSGLVELRYRVL